MLKLVPVLTLSASLLLATTSAFPNPNNSPVPITNPFDEWRVAYFRELPAANQILIIGGYHDTEILDVTDVVVTEDNISFSYQEAPFVVNILHHHQVPYEVIHMNITAPDLGPVVASEVAVMQSQ